MFQSSGRILWFYDKGRILNEGSNKNGKAWRKNKYVKKNDGKSFAKRKIAELIAVSLFA
jgi:hypothetical protein